MSEPSFDDFTRHAAEVLSRRGTLRTLGSAAVVAGLMSPVLTEAKKGGKGKKDKCKKQVGRCKESLAKACETLFGLENVAECVDLFDECCEPLGSCNVAAGADCLVQRIEQL
jgi:hypothetical protein